jgi:hypothetical protein
MDTRTPGLANEMHELEQPSKDRQEKEEPTTATGINTAVADNAEKGIPPKDNNVAGTQSKEVCRLCPPMPRVEVQDEVNEMMDLKPAPVKRGRPRRKEEGKATALFPDRGSVQDRISVNCLNPWLCCGEKSECSSQARPGPALTPQGSLQYSPRESSVEIQQP